MIHRSRGFFASIRYDHGLVGRIAQIERIEQARNHEFADKKYRDAECHVSDRQR